MSWGSNIVKQGASGDIADPWYVTLAGAIGSIIANQGDPNADQTKAWWVALRSVAKGASVAAGITSTAIDADHQGVDVALQTGTKTIGAVTAPGAAALALDATLTGGTQIAQVRGGAKGATVAAAVTSTAIDADHQGLDVALQTGTSTIGAVTAPGGGALALDATLTGGTQIAQVRGGAKGATVAAAVTSSANGVDHQGLDVSIQTGTNTIGAVTAPGAAALALDATLTGGTQIAQVRGGAKGATVAAAITSSANGADHQGIDNVEQFAPAAEDNTNGVYAMCNKPIAVNTYAPSLATNFGAATKANVKASSGNVLAVFVTNANAAVRYFQLHNKASAPAAGEVPLYSFPVQPNGGGVELGDEFFVGSGGYFSTGIGWAWSTTVATFTDSATASDENTIIHYK